MTEADRRLVETRMKNADYEKIILAQGNALSAIKSEIDRKMDSVRAHNSTHSSKRDLPNYIYEWRKYIERAQLRATCILGEMKDRKHGTEPEQGRLMP